MSYPKYLGYDYAINPDNTNSGDFEPRFDGSGIENVGINKNKMAKQADMYYSGFPIEGYTGRGRFND